MEHDKAHIGKELRHVILKLIILKRIKAKRGGIYSYAILKGLSKVESSHFCISNPKEIKNDVYNTIASLEKSGYIKMRRRVQDGRLKKYYEITATGDAVLNSAMRDFLTALSTIKTLFE
jgi:DNA-binding PadR family transcriptional regulator